MQMSNILRFICPECDKTKETRRDEIIQQMAKWVNSEALSTMVSAFGKEIPNLPLREKIEWLNEFANEWDYRKKQANQGERWNVTEDPIAQTNSTIILECTKELGLYDIDFPLEVPDYILPLGGARLSNYARPEKAKEIIDKMDIQSKTIVALSGTRPINEVERPFLEEYAPDAATEYEAISQGMEKVFTLTEGKYSEEHSRNENINLEWALREYDEKYNGSKIISLAAPSTDPARRANSQDTFMFFLEKFNITKGDRLLLVTSCIYVPFQLLRFMDLAIEKEFYVDCIGIKNDDKKGTAFSQTTNYCQETKAAINAIKSLADKWDI